MNNIIRGKREHAEAERADGVGGATPGRRGVLGGLAALPVLFNVGSATPALADSTARPGGAPTRIAMLSGFTEGWYELIHANGRADRVTWDSSKLPYLWVYGEFGATNESPYRDRFYTLALQALSRNPYPRSTSIL